MPPNRMLAIVLVAAAVGLGGGGASARDIGPLAEAMFDRIDTNRDGFITRDEARAARDRMFDRLDADGDGVLTVAEIEAARDRAAARGASRLAWLAELRAQMAPPSERLAALDRNGDGRISREEFVDGESVWFERIDDGGRGLSKADFASFLDNVR